MASAPEFLGIRAWFNSRPLAMRELRGKVVLIDFWTYTCINCIRTLPHMKQLHEKYYDKGLVIIGIHTPEFEFEKDPKNVEVGIRKHGIPYPVALDSDYVMWTLYRNSYWPRQYLVDINGKIRYDHIGEGGYEEIEKNVRELLFEAGYLKDLSSEGREALSDVLEAILRFPLGMTPETYLGYARGRGFGNLEACTPERCTLFTDRGSHRRDVVYLQGEWVQEREFVRHGSEEEGYVLLKFFAKSVNAVISSYSGNSFTVEVQLDGRYLTKENMGMDVRIDEGGRSLVLIDHPDMYNLVEAKEQGERELKMVTNSQDFVLYAYTFG